MGKQKTRVKALLAVPAIVLAAVLCAYRFMAINSDISYSIKRVRIGEPAQSNLGGIYDGSGPTVTVEGVRELTPEELAELSSRPSLEEYLGKDARIVVVFATSSESEAISSEAQSDLYLQSGVVSWQCDPMIAAELDEHPLPTLQADVNTVPLIYLVSPDRSGSRTWDELNATGFSLVTSTWPQRVSVELGRIGE